MNWRIKFKLFQISTNAIIFLAIGLIAFLTGKYIETVGLFISFVWLRYTFGKTYHSNSLWVCILISIIIFVIAIIFMPNKHLSLLTCIIFGLIIDYVAYKYKDYKDNKLKLEELKELSLQSKRANEIAETEGTAKKGEAVRAMEFSVDTCSENELIERCKALRLSEENTKLAVEFFIKKTKHSILADDLKVDEFSITRRKYRLKQKLNKK